MLVPDLAQVELPTTSTVELARCLALVDLEIGAEVEVEELDLLDLMLVQLVEMVETVELHQLLEQAHFMQAVEVAAEDQVVTQVALQPQVEVVEQVEVEVVELLLTQLDVL